MKNKNKKTSAFLPYEIGSKVYVIEKYDGYVRQGDDYYYINRGRNNCNRVFITEHIVESYIINQEGVFVAEQSNDGLYPIEFYQEVGEYDWEVLKQSEFIFGSYFDAVAHIKKLSRGNELRVGSDKGLDNAERE